MEDKAKNEIMESINVFSAAVDKQFLDMKSEISGVKSEISGVKSEISGVKSEISEMKTVMATKRDLNITKAEILDGVDDKLANLKGDLVVLMRREDKKVSELITVLRDKQVLSPEEAERLLALNPFPQATS